MDANQWREEEVRGYLSVLMLGVLVLMGGCASQEVSPPEAVAKNTGVRIHSDPLLQSPPLTPIPPALTKHPLQNAHLTLHVGKTGKLARLGHNHLVTGKLNGSVWLDDQGTLHASARITVNELVVDDPDRRTAQGANGNTDYESVPTAKNIRDTRANMLGEKVLDAARHPYITATAKAPSAAAEFAHADAGSLSTQFSFTLRGANSVQDTTLNWRRTNQTIHWSTTLTLSHQQFGMTPFSALGGALRVADDLRVELQGSLPDPFSLGSD